MICGLRTHCMRCGQKLDIVSFWLRLTLCERCGEDVAQEAREQLP